LSAWAGGRTLTARAACSKLFCADLQPCGQLMARMRVHVQLEKQQAQHLGVCLQWLADVCCCCCCRCCTLCVLTSAAGWRMRCRTLLLRSTQIHPQLSASTAERCCLSAWGSRQQRLQTMTQQSLWMHAMQATSSRGGCVHAPLASMRRLHGTLPGAQVSGVRRQATGLSQRVTVGHTLHGTCKPMRHTGQYLLGYGAAARATNGCFCLGCSVLLSCMQVDRAVHR
jgi:hypothetical protein